MVVFTAKFIALAACLLAIAPQALANEHESHEIALTKRFSLIKPGSDEVVDLDSLHAQLEHLQVKYQTNFDNYRVNTGKKHKLRHGKKSSKKDKRAASSIALTNMFNGTFWSGQVTYGTQNLQVDFDTGSSDMIVNKSAFKPGKSAKKLNKTFSTAYVDGTTSSGQIYTDSFRIGALTAKNVAIGRSSGEFFANGGTTVGIAGMGFPSISQLGLPPFFDALMNGGRLTKKIFTFTINPVKSRLSIGKVPQYVDANSITYIDIDPSQGFWETKGSINGIATDIVFDTGSTLTNLPTSLAQQLFATIPGVKTVNQNGMLLGTIDCNANVQVVIQAGAYSQALSSSSSFFGKVSAGSSNCYLSIVGFSNIQDGIIVGDNFFQNVHAVFDRENNRLGFAKQ